jgi:hypothetical protein
VLIMGLRRLSRAAPRRTGIAALAVAGGLALAAPALAQALPGPDSGQPPPGAPAVKVTEIAPIPDQPPAGTPAVKVTEIAPIPNQPANLHPVKAGPPVGKPNDEPNARPHLHQVDQGTAVSGPDQGG